jgi:hypothetical protein
VSDKERDQQAAGDDAAADAREDLELTEEDADQVAGGLIFKFAPITESPDFHFDK